MFGKKLRLFTLFGFSVNIDASWFIIVLLVTWSLATAYFPSQHEELSAKTYWVMGLFGTLGLFVSILLHEFAHSVVARRYGIPMEGITLFIFGGVAEMKEEPSSAKVELFVAIAGPIASIVIAATCGMLSMVGEAAQWPVPIVGVLSYLSFINGVLVAFNIIPAFPLDGGRVLRALLWQIRGSLKWATRVTAGIGGAFGTVLIILGVLTVMAGNFVGGMWQFLIGMFLRSAAQMSYQQLLVRRALEGETVRRFMHADPITVSPTTTIEQLVEDFVYRFHHKMFPVTEGDRLLGCVTTAEIRTVPRDQWAVRTASDIIQPCGEQNTIDVDMDAVRALATMSRSRASRLMVVDDDRLCGIVTLKDLLKFIELKVELEEDSERWHSGPRQGHDEVEEKELV